MLDMPRYITSTIKFSGGVYPRGDFAYFNPTLSNIFYTVKKDSLVPVFRITYGHKTMPDIVKENDVLNDFKKFSFQFCTFIRDSNYMGFNFQRGRSM
jgi:hypothetical protein